MIAVGADTQSVGLLIALFNLVLSLLCVKAPSIIEKIGATKRGIIILSCFNVYTWAPLILMFLLPLPVKLAPVWLAVLWLINLAPAVLLNILRDSWLANLISSHYMGRYLGKRLAITSVSHLVTFLVMGYILDNTRGQLSTSFATIFTISMVASFLCFIIYINMHNPPVIKEENKKNLKFSTFISELKDKKLSKFILFISLFNLTVNLCGPLYAVYMLNNLNFSYSTFAMVLAAEYLARITSVHFWGRFADRVGNIRVLGIVTRLIPFVPILWLFSPNAVYLVLVQMLSGVCWAAFDLSNQGYIYQVAPQSNKLLYIVYNKSIGLMCIALGGLLGVYLLKGIPPLEGTQITSIFLLSGIFRLVVVVFMFNRLIDFAFPFSQSGIQEIDMDSAFNKMARKRGLYHHPAKWKEYASMILPLETKVVALSKRALYYHADKWRDFAGIASPPGTKTIAVNSKVAPSKRRLYYHPDKWKEYIGIASPPENRTVAVNKKVAPSKRRLYYQPDKWQEFAGMVSSPETRTVAMNKKVAPSKRGLYYRQDEWENYARVVPVT